MQTSFKLRHTQNIITLHTGQTNVFLTSSWSTSSLARHDTWYTRWQLVQQITSPPAWHSKQYQSWPSFTNCNTSLHVMIHVRNEKPDLSKLKDCSYKINTMVHYGSCTTHCSTYLLLTSRKRTLSWACCQWCICTHTHTQTTLKRCTLWRKLTFQRHSSCHTT
jgi:hypothetical protein